VIIGGGFAGLASATHLEREENLEIILIDKSNHHLFQPLLYQVATAALSPAKITYPLREIFRKSPHVHVIMAEVTSIDKENKRIFLSAGEAVGYDVLIVGTGSSHCYFGKKEWEPLAPGLKTIQDAITVRERILTSFEIAERLGDVKEATAYLQFVIIGGGPTGVEMAGAIADIAKTNLKDNYRKIHPDKAKIFLIEALPHILPSYSSTLSSCAKKDLEKLGVTVLTHTRVTSITEEGLYMGDTFLPSKNIIWAAGNEASPLLATLNTPLDAQRRVIVEKDLSLPGYREIFVVGDAASVPGLGATAAVAIQEGKYVAKIIQKEIPPENRPPFKYKDRGSMATIGRGKAVAQIKSLEFSGVLAWISWGLLHLIYLVGFRNRLRVLFEWISLFITRRRCATLILGSVDHKLPK
jgi:NADH dehydrogenase